MIKNLYDFTNKKILFFSPEITWNLYCGNSIWASVFLKLIKKKYNCSIDVPECLLYKIKNKNNIFKNELDVKFTRIFEPGNFISLASGCFSVKTEYLINYFFTVEKFYDYVIIRSIGLMHNLSYLINKLDITTRKRIKDKIIYIVIDRPEENLFMNNLHNTFHMTLVKYFKEKKNKNVPQYIIPPLLRDEEVYEKDYTFENIVYDFCYVGTFHERSKIENVLDCFIGVKYKIIIAGKVQSLFLEKFNLLKEKYKKNKNIIFKTSLEGISADQGNDIIKMSKFGIRVDNPVECLSSKVLNYICYNRIPIVQRIKTHELLLGKDYPFYIDNNPNKVKQDLASLIKNITNDNILISLDKVKKAKKKLNINDLIKNNFSILA